VETALPESIGAADRRPWRSRARPRPARRTAWRGPENRPERPEVVPLRSGGRDVIGEAGSRWKTRAPACRTAVHGGTCRSASLHHRASRRRRHPKSGLYTTADIHPTREPWSPIETRRRDIRGVGRCGSRMASLDPTTAPDQLPTHRISVFLGLDRAPGPAGRKDVGVVLQTPLLDDRLTPRGAVVERR